MIYESKRKIIYKSTKTFNDIIQIMWASWLSHDKLRNDTDYYVDAIIKIEVIYYKCYNFSF
jgi:hypothetical protein